MKVEGFLILAIVAVARIAQVGAFNDYPGSEDGSFPVVIGKNVAGAFFGAARVWDLIGGISTMVSTGIVVLEEIYLDILRIVKLFIGGHSPRQDCLEEQKVLINGLLQCPPSLPITPFNPDLPKPFNEPTPFNGPRPFKRLKSSLRKRLPNYPSLLRQNLGFGGKPPMLNPIIGFPGLR